MLRVFGVLFPVLVIFICVASKEEEDIKKDVLVLTVATEETDGFKRYQRSAKVYGIDVKVLGLGESWEGGDVKRTTGGGQKVNLLKEEVDKHKDDKEKIIIFTDSYDVIFLSGLQKIVEEFEQMEARVLFSAEGFCWPDESLASHYPAVERGKRYLNSGGFIAYAPELYSILTHSKLESADDDQLFYTKVYLDKERRKELQMKLDHKSRIFQNLHGAAGDVELRFKGKEAYLQNTAYNTVPLILHGNGPSKLVLNTMGNYLARSWSLEDGCLACWEDMKSLKELQLKQYPKVLMAIFIEHPTPFIEEFFERIGAIEYPKERIDLFIHNAAQYHIKHMAKFLGDHEKKYSSVKKIVVSDRVKEWHARNLAIEQCVKKNCEYYLNVDSEAHLDNPHILTLLIEQNRKILAPLLIRPYKAWSNFWGSLTSDGFYARSIDYMDIVQNTRRGVWNVPYISSCYLINGTLIHDEKTRPNYIHNLLDADMAFCHNIRAQDIFMFVSNRIEWGHLVSAENFDTQHINNELYQLFENRWDWEQRYLHENYSVNLDINVAVKMPCPDVYWFPMLSPKYCAELIEEMEGHGQWSDGSTNDKRLDGGYENVPTRDIHMKQVGMEPHWLEFLRLYVVPLQERVFIGYYHNPPRAIMNFVVRYKPDEQPSLRPHHDSSTYTINIALNRRGIDYEGGGAKFLRYNCSVEDTLQGWMLMHPGRLTHFHEGLETKKGTRYIMISFIDP